MDQSAVYTNNLKEYVSRPIGYFRIGCSLHKALNKSTTTIQDIMKWNWQIAECSSKPVIGITQYLYPIDTKLVHIDADGNVVYGTIFRPTKNMTMDSDLLTATSIITCHSSMIDSIDKENMDKDKQKKLQIFNILAQYSLMNTNLSMSNNMTISAFIAVDKLCNLIESDIIDELMEII